MTTPAQALANHANAQHSTGPRTDEGKATSALNATRHALTSRGLIVPLGLESAFTDLEETLRINLIPIGGLEETLFTRILECTWNLHRCRLAQAQLFEQALDPSIDPLLENEQNEPKFARIDKYARQFENSMYKGMRELGKLQTEAQYRAAVCPLSDEEIDDPELFSQSPQSRSSVCDFQQVNAAARRSTKKITPFQNQAASDRAGMAFLEMITAPPVLNNKMMANLPAEDVTEDLADAA